MFFFLSCSLKTIVVYSYHYLKKKKNRRREKQDAEILIDNRITNVYYNIFIVIFNILHAYKITVKKYLIRRTLIRRNKD